MTARDKFHAGLFMVLVCANEDLTHAEKTKILKVAYRLIREAMTTINPSVMEQEDIPF